MGLKRTPLSTPHRRVVYCAVSPGVDAPGLTHKQFASPLFSSVTSCVLRAHSRVTLLMWCFLIGTL
jgi:hypothetical protein